MKKKMSGFKKATIIAAAAVFFIAVNVAPAVTRSVTRDAAVHVTASIIADTDLRGTITNGWDKVTVHNKSETIWVGLHPLTFNRTAEAAGINTFTEMTLFLPPVGTVTITAEAVIILRHIAESGSADLIIERQKNI